MRVIKWLRFFLFEPAAYHCKPLMRKHEWRKAKKGEQFPVCIHCGKQCTWATGYLLNSGTYLWPDREAIALMDKL